MEMPATRPRSGASPSQSGTRRRAEEAGLSDRVRFSLTDFRDVTGPFDRIVSVGMFEAVGAPAFAAYFETLRRLLTDDGVALIHSIGRQTPPSTSTPTCSIPAPIFGGRA